ncbi:hypothetical protein Bpfe_027336, partial [Biomphalaria pfeifferi]
ATRTGRRHEEAQQRNGRGADFLSASRNVPKRGKISRCGPHERCRPNTRIAERKGQCQLQEQ